VDRCTEYLQSQTGGDANSSNPSRFESARAVYKTLKIGIAANGYFQLNYNSFDANGNFDVYVEVTEPSDSLRQLEIWTVTSGFSDDKVRATSIWAKPIIDDFGDRP